MIADNRGSCRMRFSLSKLVLTPLLGAVAACSPDIKSDVPVLPVPALAAGSDLFLRYESPGSEVILISSSGIGGGVYSCDPRQATIAPASAEAWERARSEIVKCSAQLVGACHLYIDHSSNSLACDKQHIVTEGDTVLEWRCGPGTDRLGAVISARGGPKGSFMPFMGRTWSDQQHFHEVFEVPDMRRVGAAVRLPFTSKEGALKPCWMNDLRYVVYLDPRGGRLCIVPTGITNGEFP